MNADTEAPVGLPALFVAIVGQVVFWLVHLLNHDRCRALAITSWMLPCAVWAGSTGGVLPDGAQLKIDNPEDGVPAGVARLSDGSSVVGWTEGGRELWAQRFDTDRAPVGPSRQLACTGGENCRGGEIVGDTAGGYWGTWTEADALGHAFLRKFAPDGAPLSAPISLGVPTQKTGTAQANLAAPPEGGVLATWTLVEFEFEGLSWRTDLRALKFAADGLPIGTAQTLNISPLSLVFDTDVAVSPSGRFVAVWTGLRKLGGGNVKISVRFRLLDEDGTPDGPPGTANVLDANVYSFPKVASLGSTGFLVVWNTDEPRAHYRIFSWSGQPLTKELTLEPEDGRVAWAEATEDGAALVLLRSLSGTLSAVLVGKTGLRASGVVAPETAGGSASTAVSAGRFVASWRSPSEGAHELTARGFKLLALFGNGFESGDTSAWSTTVP